MSTDSDRRYSDWTKRLCLRLYVNGIGFQDIEHIIEVAHTTVMHGVQQVRALSPHAYDPDDIPQVGELDELQILVGQKHHKVWLWTVVDHFHSGILIRVVGDHRAETFRPL